MPDANVEIFRQMLDAFDRGDREAWLALHDRDYELIPSGTWPEVEAIHGPEAGWDFYLQASEPFERHAFGDTAKAVTAGADQVLVHQRNEVRGRASGAAVELDYWVVVTFRKGKVLRDEWFTDRVEALEAAGLRE